MPGRAMLLRRVALLLLGAALPFGPSAAAQAAARSGYVIVVHASNPVAELSRQEVARFFLKRSGAWRTGLLVAPVDLPPESATRVAFSNAILGQSPKAVSTYWLQEIFARRAQPPPVRVTAAAVIAFVAANPGAIGYVPDDTPLNGVHSVTVTP
jgi:ABC-type phosphate transport system substrate-binding protein